MEPHARTTLRRALALAIAPLILYLASGPFFASGTLRLALAAAVPLAYNGILVLRRRRLDPIAVAASIGFALGCIGSALSGGSELPLKLHEATVTFLIGVVLLGAALLRRPPPIGRFVRVPDATTQLDTTLSVLVGGFLVLHALLHFVLATSLSTATYLVVGRIVNVATVGLGALCLFAFLRRAREH